MDIKSFLNVVQKSLWATDFFEQLDLPLQVVPNKWQKPLACLLLRKETQQK